MRALKSKRRLDTLVSEARLRRSGRIGKVFYFSVVLAVCFYLLHVLAANRLYLQAPGSVTKDNVVLAPDYNGMVVDVLVEDGQTVHADMAVAQLRSIDVLADVADLVIDVNRLSGDLAARRSRLNVLDTLIPTARVRVATLRDSLADSKKLLQQGYSTRKRLEDLEEKYYEAERELSQLQAERGTLAEEIARGEQNYAVAGASLAQLRGHYADGLIRASIGGTVSELDIHPGQIVPRGTPLMRILSGPAYVVGFMEPGRLFRAEVGDEVFVRVGLTQVRGEIVEILGIAPAIPSEFQISFDSTQRMQQFRVRVDDGLPAEMPLFTTVKVTGTWNVVSRVVALLQALRAPDETGS